MFFTLESTPVRHPKRERLAPPWMPEARSPHDALMLALEPRLLFDASGLITGLDLIPDHGTLADAPPGHAPSSAAHGPEAHDPILPPAFEGPDAGHLIEGLPGPLPAQPHALVSDLVFIDARVDHYPALVSDLPDTARVVVLDPSAGGVDQILAALSKQDDIQTIHIVCHGGSGSITLGDTVLSGQTIDQYSDLLADWGDHLSEGADILIYGCNVAKGTEGQAFLAELSEITGADVAASDDITGAADQGGDWDLETRIGIVESGVVFSDHAMETYRDILSTYTVDDITDTQNVAADGVDIGDGLNLREAIELAKQNPGADTIEFDPTLSGSTISLNDAYGALVIDDPNALYINGDLDGDGTPDITVAMTNDGDSVFKLSNTTATLNGLTIRDGYHAHFGGGIYSDNSDLTLSHCLVNYNETGLSAGSTKYGGGGIYQKAGTLKIYDSDISHNTTGGYGGGGGIHSDNGTLIIKNSTISYNSATYGYGGGLYIYGGTTETTGCSIHDNDAYHSGGGISSYKNTFTDNGSAITYNYADYLGGGIAAGYGTLTLKNTTLDYNSAFYGGGIAALANHTTISDNTTLDHNAAYITGGGIYQSQGNLAISHSTISNNYAYLGLGGGIYNYGGTTEIDTSTIDHNAAYYYGGGIAAYKGTVTDEGSTISYNYAYAGAGISTFKSTLTVKGSTFSDNYAYVMGGGIAAMDGTLKIYNTIFQRNTALSYGPLAESGGGSIASLDNTTYIYDSTISDSSAYYGGGIMASQGSVTISNSLLANNVGLEYGGGIYSVDAQISLTNSTISGNTAEGRNSGTGKGGGIYNGLDTDLNPANDASASLYHCTLAYNSADSGEGIYNSADGSISMGHTIVADGISTVAAITSAGRNLFSQDIVSGSDASDILGGYAGLEALADNGGPTHTHALKLNSDALDSGDPALTPGGGAPLTDQRGTGFTRVIGAIDIGAVEMNFPPSATDDAFATDQNSPVTTGSVLANDTDPNASDTLTVTGLDTTGTRGQVTDNGDGTFDYDPNGQFDYLAEGESATDTFTYTVSDDSGATDTATVTITVTGKNDAPDALSDTDTTNEDHAIAAIDVLANDSDPDSSDTLTVTGLDTTGTKGQVTDNGDGTFRYDPNGQFHYLESGDTATDSFTYTISDGNGGTDTATVTITITGRSEDPGPANSRPEAESDEGTTDEETPLAAIDVLANDTDPDSSDTLTVSGLDTTGTKGEVTDNGDGTFSYDPDGRFEYLAEGETATDSFTYTVSDGHGGSDTATVTITVSGKNDAPKPGPDEGATDEETPLAAIDVLANDTDPDSSDTLTVSGLDTTGTRGEVTDNGDGTFSYDPDGRFEYLAEGETATDSFTYTVSDGHGGSDTATVTITVSGKNDAPKARPDEGATTTDTPLAAIDVLANDTDPDSSDTLTVSGLDTTGTKGEVTDNGDGTFSYDPDGRFEYLAEGETATDSFTYTVSDGHGGTDTATVTITVSGIAGNINHPPTANPDGFETDKDTAFTTGSVMDNDEDPDTADTLTVTGLETTGTKGLVTDNGDGTFTYDPNGQFEDLAEGETATDTFSYTISDGRGGTDNATVTVTISGITENPNHQPTDSPEGDPEYLLDDPASGLTGFGSNWGEPGFLRPGGRLLGGLFNHSRMDPMSQAHGRPFGPEMVPGHEGYEPPEDASPPEDEAPAEGEAPPEGEPVPGESVPPDGSSPPSDAPPEGTESDPGTGPDGSPDPETADRGEAMIQTFEGAFTGFSEQLRIQANRFEKEQMTFLESLGSDAA